MTVNQCCLATQKDGVIKEMENRMNQVTKSNPVDLRTIRTVKNIHFKNLHLRL